MTHTFHVRNVVPRLAIVASLMVAFALSAAPIEARQHRARLSKDLADRLTARVASPVDVIVTASEDQAQELTARHGAQIKKRMRGAVVLEVTGEQLESLSADTTVVSISGDIAVRSMGMTAESIGADQVWQGGALEGLQGYSGRGVGVAFIDTGVDATHPRLRGRVALSLDFTRERTAAAASTRTATARTSRASLARWRRTPR